jgi:hypothetical protein
MKTQLLFTLTLSLIALNACAVPSTTDSSSTTANPDAKGAPHEPASPGAKDAAAPAAADPKPDANTAQKPLVLDALVGKYASTLGALGTNVEAVGIFDEADQWYSQASQFEISKVAVKYQDKDVFFPYIKFTSAGSLWSISFQSYMSIAATAQPGLYSVSTGALNLSTISQNKVAFQFFFMVNADNKVEITQSEVVVRDCLVGQAYCQNVSQNVGFLDGLFQKVE